MYELLISVEELAALRGTAVVFDCRFRLDDPGAGSQFYQQSHIPGAHYAHLDQHLSGPVQALETGRHPLPDPSAFRHWLGQCGVGADTQVVVYDDMGGLFASRLWWMLRWQGHRSAALLDGGWQAWCAGQTTDALQPDTNALGPLLERPALVETLSAEQVQGSSHRPLDARSPERYRGEVEPFGPVAGHIPGAWCLPFGAHLENGFWQERAKIAARLDAYGDDVVLYCGSGVSACSNALAYALAGRDVPALYVGSWSHWSQDTSKFAIETGWPDDHPTLE